MGVLTGFDPSAMTRAEIDGALAKITAANREAFYLGDEAEGKRLADISDSDGLVLFEYGRCMGATATRNARAQSWWPASRRKATAAAVSQPSPVNCSRPFSVRQRPTSGRPDGVHRLIDRGHHVLEAGARASDLFALVDLATQCAENPAAARADALLHAITRTGELHAWNGPDR